MTIKGKKAKDLRQTVRPTHLQTVKGLINKGQLNDDDEMIGSMLVVDSRNLRASRCLPQARTLRHRRCMEKHQGDANDPRRVTR